MVSKELIFVLAMLLTIGLSAQEVTSEQDTLAVKKSEVEGLVSLYRFMLNTVGASSTPVSERETVINSSYQKIFRDVDVQIEDDLVSDREVPLNKSVKGYLRDVDFFFKNASFEFDEVQVKADTNELGEYYFKAEMVCRLTALDLNDSLVNRTYNRYIEVNEIEGEGLKIVSVYTIGTDPMQQLLDWWNEMDSTWQSLFLELSAIDSMNMEVLQKLVIRDSLDLSGQASISDVSPLIQLRRLTYLDLSGTQVDGLMPIRYAFGLKYLDVSETPIDSIEVFSYLPKVEVLDVSGCDLLSGGFLSETLQLRELDLSETSFLDYSLLANLSKLQWLDLSGSTFQNTAPLSGLPELAYLNLSGTPMQSIELTQPLPNLVEVDLSNTYIMTVDFLQMMPEVRQLNVDYTQVADLSPVMGNPELRKVYADFTKVSAPQVSQLMQARQGLLILTETDQLISWWNELSDDWKSALMEIGRWSDIPTIEELIVLLQTDSLDLSGKNVSAGEPLKRFKQLKFLTVSGSSLSDLSFVKELGKLNWLNASNSEIITLEGVQHLKRLEYLDVSSTVIQSIGLANQLPSLISLNVNETKIPRSQIESYVEGHPDQLVIYRKKELQAWWDNLDGDYKKLLAPKLGDYSVANLHKLSVANSLKLEAISIRNFDQFEVFTFLVTLSVERAQENYLPDLTGFSRLRTLRWTNGPLITMEPLRSLPNLTEISISNTAIEDLSPLDEHPSLEILDCSSTQVRSIKPLKEIYSLKSLNISNTGVWQLNWLYDIRGIETLVCFNSRVSDRKLAQFKEQFPSCEVTNF